VATDCDYELVIVGGGLAGLTAALYGARFGLHTCLVEHMAAGGQVLNVEKIENFPGFPQGISGFDLGPIVQEQAENAGAEFSMDTVVGLGVEEDVRVVRCESAELRARSVIVAAGSALRSLGIPGEAEFMGKGVSHCASCDAPFYIGKDVVVIGGGDSALDEAAVLADHDVGHITIVHRGPSFLKAQKVAVDRLSGHANVDALFNTRVMEIVGEQTVQKVRLSGNGAPDELPVAGAFIFVGLEPNSAFVSGVVDLDSAGHVKVDSRLQTSTPGVFAAGDIRAGSARQLVAAAGDGASAAVFAAEYLRARWR
jgi:thioredoxin reductase (NADPH)